jgi:hypothetical protein
MGAVEYVVWSYTSGGARIWGVHVHLKNARVQATEKSRLGHTVYIAKHIQRIASDTSGPEYF